MSKKNTQRPMSPYMLGSAYRFEFQTILSLSFRMTGIFFALILTPLACLWVLMLAMGPESFASIQAFMGSWIGKVIAILSALVVSYHLCGGIRHLAWDSGRFFSKEQIKSTGIVAVIGTLAVFAATVWCAL